jgi:chromate transporter
MAWIDAVLSSPTWQFCAHIALLATTAIGGGILAVISDIHRFVVETNHWITDEQFAAAFALAQASPGPNFLYVSIIGWQMSGWLGVVASSAAIVVPPSLVCYAVIRIGGRGTSERFRKAVRSGLVPLSAGLMCASAWVLTNAIDTNWRLALMTGVFSVLLLRTKIHPLWFIAAGAVAGGLGLV